MGRKLVPGVNDLASLYPEVAKEADGWDPSQVSGSSHKKLPWCCEKQHSWEATVTNRTGAGSGCPYCSGQKALIGFNDLATLFPEVAKNADGWDPTTVTAKSGQKKAWRCERGHSWLAVVANRTPPDPSGCPFCLGTRCEAGVNDLATLFPEVAKEADGWDPTTVTTKSSQTKRWRCSKGHAWDTQVTHRVPPKSSGCPYCAGQKAVSGETDLATVFPELAKEADGWDPTVVLPGSHSKRTWKCCKGHKWKATVKDRIPPKNSNCPFCWGRVAEPGVSDLKTLFPEVAKEAFGWDPSVVRPGSAKRYEWKCEQGHTWHASVNSRTNPYTKSGCPECAEGGFKESLPAWFYLLERVGEQQFGVTNHPKNRLYEHSRHNWSEVEVVGPFPGDEVLALEKKLKKWLRREVGLVPGTHENWFTASLEVRSLAELKARSGVETDLF